MSVDEARSWPGIAPRQRVLMLDAFDALRDRRPWLPPCRPAGSNPLGGERQRLALATALAATAPADALRVR